MFSKAYAAAVQGIEGCIVRAEADVSDGLPLFSLVGFLSSEVKEAKERVRIALKNQGFRFPPRHITVNLSPADIRKEGTGYDLAIAVALLGAFGYFEEELVQNIVFAGELSLDGKIKGVKGILPIAHAAAENGFKRLIVSRENGQEGALAGNISVFGVNDLKELVSLFQEENWDDFRVQKQEYKEEILEETIDFSDIRGQAAARRAVEIAVAGRHNLLMIGPPGSGKTMIAKRIPGIMPQLSQKERMEISKIYSVAGLLSSNQPFVTTRPFRAPHHTITQTALVGGGRSPKPGEVSLASGGVLFLDEFPEFQKQTIEVLRQPMEEGRVTINRLHGNYTYPANCQVICAMNPCKCGYYPDSRKCHCTQAEVRKYLGRISQPILDRIDLCTETVPVKYQDLSSQESIEESTQCIKERISAAWKIQENRYKKENFISNADVPMKQAKEYFRLEREASEYLEENFDRLELSARGYAKIIKVGRTIADLARTETIQKNHIVEAISYRVADRKFWGVSI